MNQITSLLWCDPQRTDLEIGHCFHCVASVGGSSLHPRHYHPIQAIDADMRGASKMSTTPNLLDPIHPGEILREDFMKPLDISINRLARDLFVPAGRIIGIVNGKRGITANTALRLGKYFGLAPQTWMGLQSEYDLRVAQRAIGHWSNGQA